MSTKVKIALAVLVCTAALAVTAAVATPKAQAWPWSSQVVLNGTITAPWTLLGDQVTWAWVSASDGESGWAWLGAPTSKWSRPYSFTFTRVPYSGMWVTVTAGTAVVGQRQSSFGVSRPTVGQYATRNIYWAY